MQIEELFNISMQLHRIRAEIRIEDDMELAQRNFIKLESYSDMFIVLIRKEQEKRNMARVNQLQAVLEIVIDLSQAYQQKYPQFRTQIYWHQIPSAFRNRDQYQY